MKWRHPARSVGKLWGYLWFACLGLFVAGETVQAAPAIRVLFIGNSQTTVWDLPQMIKTLADSAPEERARIEFGRATKGGASLKKHWDAGEAAGAALAMINQEKWDYVVLQEIYNATQAEFGDYAMKFDEVIRKSGARTVLFATAHVTEYYHPDARFPESFMPLNEMQTALGKSHGILVAAAGYTWIHYLGPTPSEAQLLDLYDKDRGHPGAKGTYLYACLLYAVLTRTNPEGLTHEFPQIRGGILIPPAEAVEMQRVAWKQYSENLP